jgi:hypothetical protein
MRHSLTRRRPCRRDHGCAGRRYAAARCGWEAWVRGDLDLVLVRFAADFQYERRQFRLPRRTLRTMSNAGSKGGLNVTISAALAAVLEQYHLAAVPFVRGDCEPYKAVFSHREDVSLGNPFGPFRRGWQEVSATIERASALYRDGEVIGFENLTTHATPDLAYIVEVEHTRPRGYARAAVAPRPEGRRHPGLLARRLRTASDEGHVATDWAPNRLSLARAPRSSHAVRQASVGYWQNSSER